MNDEPRKPDDEPMVSKDVPAPWENRTPDQQPGNLQQRMSGDEYLADESQQATYLADKDQSLDSKIRGGGQDLGGEANEEITRLCPGCGKVTKFVQSQCTNCAYKLSPEGQSAEQIAPPFVPPSETGAAWRVLGIVVLVIIVLGVGMYFVVQGLNNSDAETVTTPTETGMAGADEEDKPFNAATIDDGFHTRLQAALEDGNAAWASADVDAYVYRYGIFEHVEPGESQVIRVSAYTGGADAESAIEEPHASTFREAMSGFMTPLNERGGVDASVFLVYTAGEEAPSPKDHYLRYGYYYGKEHSEELDRIIQALEGVRNSEGQYPLILSESIVRPKIRTHGGLRFIADGYGYLPIFKEDSSGNIIMGTGSRIASFVPEEVTDYYLFVYGNREDFGLDMHGPDATNYYREKISPFPYQPKKDLTNVQLVPDGKPDGIAAVVKSGELLDL